MSYTIEWIGNNTKVVFSDEVTLDEMYQINNQVIGDSRFEEMKYQIWDFSKVIRFNMDIDDAEILSTLDLSASIWNRKVKIALIGNDDYAKKIGNEYIKAMQHTAWLVEIFSDSVKAEKWCLEA